MTRGNARHEPQCRRQATDQAKSRTGEPSDELREATRSSMTIRTKSSTDWEYFSNRVNTESVHRNEKSLGRIAPRPADCSPAALDKVLVITATKSATGSESPRQAASAGRQSHVHGAPGFARRIAMGRSPHGPPAVRVDEHRPANTFRRSTAASHRLRTLDAPTTAGQ